MKNSKKENCFSQKENKSENVKINNIQNNTININEDRTFIIEGKAKIALKSEKDKNIKKENTNYNNINSRIENYFSAFYNPAQVINNSLFIK
jgi:hypothetical protein